MAHGHHDHSGEWPPLTTPSLGRVLTGIVAVLVVAALAGMAVWWPSGEPEVDRAALGYSDRFDASVTDTEIADCEGDPTSRCKVITFRLTEGPRTGFSGTIEVSVGTDTPAANLSPGDGIVVDDAGPDTPENARYSFGDRQRATPLIVLGVVFAAGVVLLGRLRGLLALVGIGVSLGVLLVYVFPALLDGSNPLGVALTAATIIAVVALYLAHGFGVRTTVALLGTLASLTLTAVLAVAFTGAAVLSGLASEESITLLSFAPGLDFRGLLLAAIVIGTLGVLDDVTVTQTSAVWELHRADPASGPRQLYRSAIRIGRDHIASTVNTLVLAYSAAALPLLLLFTQSGLAFGDVLTTETVAVEVVQTLVGSIGLVASVPLTTALACWVVTQTGSPTVPADGSAPGDDGDDGDRQDWYQAAGGPPDRSPARQSADDAFWGRPPVGREVRQDRGPGGPGPRRDREPGPAPSSPRRDRQPEPPPAPRWDPAPAPPAWDDPQGRPAPRWDRGSGSGPAPAPPAWDDPQPPPAPRRDRDPGRPPVRRRDRGSPGTW